jgi:thiamine-phosphate diphosphorylase/hydroxyethylthiazole kinase
VLADCQTARKILGPDAIIGLSVSNKEQLAKALEAGPTYLGVGPVYATPTKPDHNTPLGLDGLQQLLQHIPADLPCCAIGGINAQNAGTVMNTSPVRSLEGLAIVSAIMASPEPTGTCKSLKSLIVLSIVYEEPKKVDLTSDLLQMLRKFRENGPPLVHHITNNVSKTLHANVTLAIGASPIMSENESEFQDLARLGSSVSLVLNMGTFLGEEATKNLFINAIKAHKDCGNFIVFDPVGAGATESRRNFAKIIKKAGTTNGSMVIKGNEGEILTLAGENVSMRGVDGAGAKSGRERERELAAIISKLSRDSKGIVGGCAIETRILGMNISHI